MANEPGRMRVGPGAALLCATLTALAAAAWGCSLLGRQPEDGFTREQRIRFAEAESQLRSPDEAVRQQAAVALLSMDHPEALQTVLTALSEAEDPAIRISMLRACAMPVVHESFGHVLAAIDDPEPDVQRAAAVALSSFTRPEEIDAMLEFIRRPGTTAWQRQLLFNSLGDGLAFRAVPVLIEGLDSEEGASRIAAWQALRQISGRELHLDAEQWRRWWEVQSHRSREDVLEDHLHGMERKLQARTGELTDLQDQHRELMALVSSPESETPARLIGALASLHGIVRQYASFRLASIEQGDADGVRIDAQDHYQALRQALEDPSLQIRQNVIRFIVRVNGDYRDELIKTALEDEEPGVLVPAVEALDGSAGAGPTERLAELLSESPHEQVRESAANALGKIGTQDSTPALVEALDDKAENVRWFAVEGLRKLRATQAVPRISEMLLRDPSARVREIAASALGELRQPAAVPALRRALNDHNERVRQKAVAALLELATDNPERMVIIAQAFSEEGLNEPAEQVLDRVVEGHGAAGGQQASFQEALRLRAEIHTIRGDHAAAADDYERLDEALGGSVEVKRLALDSLLRAEQLPRLQTALGRWLAGASAEDRAALVGAAVETAENLAAADRADDARAVLQLVEQADVADLDLRLRGRIDRLRQRLGG